MGYNKTNGHAAPLDSRIAATLASDVVDKAALVSLLQEATDALSMVQTVITAETPRLHDLSNTDPDASLDLINRSKLRVERLEIAIPKLRDRIKEIEAFEYNQAWHSEADVVNARSAQSAERLKHYQKFIVWLQAEFAEIDDINAESHALHTRAPAGENRRLIDPELIARGLDHYDKEHPRLRDSLKLPDFIRASVIAFPTDPAAEFYRRAAEMNQAMTRQLAAKHAFTSGADWAAGRDLQIEQEEAEFAKKDEELRAAETKSKVEYEAKLQEAERRRLGGIK